MQLDGFDGLELVGSGGNAHVYQASQSGTEEVVAVKILRGGGDEAVTRRFERERHLMNQLETIANVVPVYDAGITDSGDPYIVMPLYSGGSLQDRIADGPMEWRDAVEVTKTLAESIALAHAKRILHLDIKPANVLLNDEGTPWLADFGIAEMMGHTASMSAKMMTPAFTPPERLDGKKPGEQTDLYGLTATLYALLTAHAPYVTEGMTGPMGVMMAILREPLNLDLLPEETPGPVRNLLLLGMAKDPDDRPRSAIELVGLLEGVLNGESVPLPASLVADSADTRDSSFDTVEGLTSPGATVATGGPNEFIVQPTVAASSQRDVSIDPVSHALVPERKSSRNLALVGAIVAVLLIGAGGLAALVLGGGSEQESAAGGDVVVAAAEAEVAIPEEESPIGDVEEPEVLGAAAQVDESSDAVSESQEIDDSADEDAVNDGSSSQPEAVQPEDTPVQPPLTVAQPAVTQPRSTVAQPAELEAGFVASAGPEGSEQTVSFRNITIGEASSYRWMFGDGGTSTQFAPSHTYSRPGTYSVTITATAADGSTDSATHSVRVDANTSSGPALEAGWTASASSSPNQQTLNFRSITIGDANTFRWDFGDGSTGSGSTISHTYASPGTYTVTITASGRGGTDTATHNVRVDPNG